MNRSLVRLFLALAVVAPISAFGLGGKVTTPQLGFPEGVSQDHVTGVLRFLREKVTFVDGYFINEFTTQKFDGQALKLTDLIRLLQAAWFELHLKFADLKDDRVAFQLFQNADHLNQLSITINTTRKDLDLSQLSIDIPASKALGEINFRQRIPKEIEPAQPITD